MAAVEKKPLRKKPPTKSDVIVKGGKEPSGAPVPPVKSQKAPPPPPAPEPPPRYEIPGYPIADGPAACRRKLSERTPVVLVALDAGTFQYLWEMAETRAREDHKKYNGGMPEITRASVELVRVLRKANKTAVERKQQ